MEYNWTLGTRDDRNILKAGIFKFSAKPIAETGMVDRPKSFIINIYSDCQCNGPVGVFLVYVSRN